jgi:hypothetical protein
MLDRTKLWLIGNDLIHEPTTVVTSEADPARNTSEPGFKRTSE